jgi:hypothetical protein
MLFALLGEPAGGCLRPSRHDLAMPMGKARAALAHRFKAT